MNKELQDIILTIDVHEEANKEEKTRIATVKSYVESKKGLVGFAELPHGDYEVIGHFRGKLVSLIAEYKTWDNFLSDNITEMEEKLLLATAEYDHVGFFVETQNYTFTPDENNTHGILNPNNPTLRKKLPTKTLAAFEGFLDTISKHPQIHVRQLRGEAQFPYSLYDLLVYLQKEHTVFSSIRNGTIHEKEYIAWYKHFLATIPSMTTIKRIEKLIMNYPNPFWLCSASEESLRQVMGNQVGMTVYSELHYRGFETDEWRAGYHRDGTPKDEPLCDFANPKNHAECKTPDHFKHSKIPSHAEGTILSNHNHPLPSADTIPSHPDRTHSQIDSIPQQRSGDLPQPPITETTAVKQEGLSVSFFPPAESHDDIGLNDKPLDCVVKCRACHQVITPDQDDESGFCRDPDCIKIRNEPSLENKLRIFLREPHSVEEIVEKYGCSSGYTHQVCMANVNSGNLKMITNPNTNINTFQRVT